MSHPLQKLIPGITDAQALIVEQMLTMANPNRHDGLAKAINTTLGAGAHSTATVLAATSAALASYGGL
jgi:hypothetical protein